MNALTADVAMALIESARRVAQDMQRPMSFAVVDNGGHPVAMLRMDGATILGAMTVLAKARTAVYCGRPSHETVERARRFPEVYGSLAAATEPGMVLSMGGFPLRTGEEIVGAFASSGGSGEQDISASEAALAHWAASIGS